ncbi:MAG: GDP-mannose 4,6-dehydratase, partial [Lachnospiraceae bacterium]|nr:GDP-mannose 4,6-dehydratase [Lachnospiraceae bacterium]
MEGKPIQIYNQGDMYRDFTYIDDIVKGVENILCNPPMTDSKGASSRLYNIGNNKPEKLMDFIETLEKCLGRKAVKEFLPMQPGDVYRTYADVSGLMQDYDFKPDTTIEEGLSRFVEWYREYYKVNEE